MATVVLKYHRFLFVFFLSVVLRLHNTCIAFGISKQIQVFRNCTLASRWKHDLQDAQFHKEGKVMIERDGLRIHEN